MSAAHLIRFFDCNFTSYLADQDSINELHGYSFQDLISPPAVACSHDVGHQDRQLAAICKRTIAVWLGGSWGATFGAGVETAGDLRDFLDCKFPGVLADQNPVIWRHIFFLSRDTLSPGRAGLRAEPGVRAKLLVIRHSGQRASESAAGSRVESR